MPEARVFIRIKALFDKRRALETALGALKNAGVEDYEAYGPTNLDNLGPLMPPRGSPVRFFATIGAIAGLGLFFYMCVGTALVYPLIVGGKAPWSNVPYIIPSYEGTILLGSGAAFIAALVWAGLWARRTPPDYDPRFGSDHYGVNVYCTAERRQEVVELLANAGAVEIDEPTGR